MGYVIVLWTLENNYSIINFKSIVSPRKEFADYKVAEDVQAKYSGKTYPARIIKKSESKPELEAELMSPTFIASQQLQDTDVDATCISKTTKDTSSSRPIAICSQSSASSSDSSADAISKKTKDTSSSRPIAICSQSSASSSDSSADVISKTTKDTSSSRSIAICSQSSASSSDSSADAISKTTKDTSSSRPIAICSQSSANSSDELSEEDLNQKKTSENGKKKRKRMEDEDSRWEKFEEILDRLKYDMRKMKKKIKTLEEQMEEQKSTTSTGESLRSVNGNTHDELYKAVESKSTWQGAVEILIAKLFTQDELRNQSISGKKTVKCGTNGPRPAMDQEKLSILQDIVINRFTNSTSRKCIVEKIQNIQKVLRRKAKAE